MAYIFSSSHSLLSHLKTLTTYLYPLMRKYANFIVPFDLSITNGGHDIYVFINSKFWITAPASSSCTLNKFFMFTILGCCNDNMNDIEVEKWRRGKRKCVESLKWIICFFKFRPYYQKRMKQTQQALEYEGVTSS